MQEQQKSSGIDPSIPTDKQQERFAFHRARLERNIETLRQRLADKRAKLGELGEDANPRIRGVYLENVASLERGLRLNQGRLEFLRPANDTDVAYRTQVYSELPRRIRDLFPAGSPVRFHGSPIDRSRDILLSHGISSSVDREGISTSFDGGGGFSVTIPEMTETTIHDFTDMLRDNCTVPAGCIFVLLPESDADAEAGRRQIMGNVDFGEEPDRLVGIMTSPENIERVQGWCVESGVDPGLVGEFFEKSEELANRHDQLAHDFAAISHRHTLAG
ncbi:hypothetical protein KC992_00995 [Candidatus Saccharibacteria bacterium]|nr:hypothetical protein [Candidatus Saccharibacteria bacterium]